ncbi:MAG: hypothetical protein V4499_03990, partial [Pseudomonadota bacterium]
DAAIDGVVCGGAGKAGPGIAAEEPDIRSQRPRKQNIGGGEEAGVFHTEREGERVGEADLGGTMRLGAYPAKLDGNSVVRSLYGADMISERHRHRYEVNVHYRSALEGAGLIFSGMSPDGQLPEIVERPDHPWFIGVQFHPELKSRPFDPHPLFAGFIEAAVKQSRLV